jgi:DNA-binding PadR family transcriptional regulator
MTTLAQSLLTRLVNDPRGCVTVGEMLDDGYAASAPQLHSVLDTLERRLFVVKHSRGCYEPTADGRAWIAAGLDIQSGQGPKPRQIASGTAAMAWAWLRIHRKGTIDDMLAVIATQSGAATRATLYRYLAALEKSGHIKRLRRGGGHARYLLIGDSGRHAPVYRKASNVVFDANQGLEIPLTPEVASHE